MLVGYARTSTADQTAGLDAQRRDLKAAECEKLFAEQVSSVAQRDQLDACLAWMREGDVIVVTKPDRLARSTAELLAIEADLSKRGIGLVVLSMGGQPLDTRNPTSKLMLTILAGVATWEREVMLERQREGIAKAKAGGRYKGRAPTVMRQAEVILAALQAGEKPSHVAKRLGGGAVERLPRHGVHPSGCLMAAVGHGALAGRPGPHYGLYQRRNHEDSPWRVCRGALRSGARDKCRRRLCGHSSASPR